MEGTEKLPITSEKYSFVGLEQFLKNVHTRKCIYYADDILDEADREMGNVGTAVQHTMHLFHTLDLPVEEHFYPVFRSDSKGTVKDWKISELACLYLKWGGDPTDLDLIVHRQTEMIDLMLNIIQMQRYFLSARVRPAG